MTKGLFSLGLAGALALGAAALAPAEPGSEPAGAVITELMGTAQLEAGTPLKAGDPVAAGQTLGTAANSLVKVRLTPVQGLTLLQHSSLTLLADAVELKAGSLVAQGVPVLRTPAGVVGTERSRGLVDLSGDRLLVVSLAGSVTIRNQGWSLILNTGEGTVFTAGQTLSAPRAISPEKLVQRFPQLPLSEPPGSLAAEPEATASPASEPTPEPTEKPIPKPGHDALDLSLGLISALPLDDSPGLVPGGMLGLSYFFQPEWGVHGALASYFSNGFNTLYIPVTMRYRYVLDPQLALYGGAGVFTAIAGQAGLVPGLLAEVGANLNFPYVGLFGGLDIGLSFSNPLAVTLGLRMGLRYPL